MWSFVLLYNRDLMYGLSKLLGATPYIAKYFGVVHKKSHSV